MLADIKELQSLSQSFQGNEKLKKESFQYLSELGKGSFGKVYKVSSVSTRILYAMKILSKDQLNTLKMVSQLKNEIALLARCNHPNIIRLHTAFEDKDSIYLVMELATGGTLFHELKREGKFSEAQTASYMADIVRAIHYLHSLKPCVLHRDLKPENVLICNGTLKLADFGWSNTSNNCRNTFCGTPDYLCPEMILGTGHNEKLDIWTLGVLMYELLHGKPPFAPQDRSIDRRLQQKITEENILAGKVVFDNGVSVEAREAIRAKLRPDPRHRPEACELFNLEFYKKHGKVLKLSESGSRNSNRNIAEGERKKIEALEVELLKTRHIATELAHKCQAQKVKMGKLEQEKQQYLSEIQKLVR